MKGGFKFPQGLPPIQQDADRREEMTATGVVRGDKTATNRNRPHLVTVGEGLVLAGWLQVQMWVGNTELCACEALQMAQRGRGCVAEHMCTTPRVRH